MNSNKIRILGVSPYHGMENIMINLANEMKNIELTTIVGDLSSGTELIVEQLSKDYDVIISRGGTAEYIKKITNTPIIEVPISVYDILRAIKMCENYNQYYAIVGFPAITSPAHTLCDLLQYNLEIVTINDIDNVENILKNLKNDGHNIIICDNITNILAKELGLTPILITSGVESIQSAFDQAIKLYKDYSIVQEKNNILTKALEKQDVFTVIFNSDLSVYFSNFPYINNSSVLNYLKELLGDFHGNSQEKSFHLIENTLYSVSINKININEKALFIFSIQENPISPKSNKYGIRFFNCNEMKDRYYNSFYKFTSSFLDINKQVEQINISSIPVVILGEKGTGKDIIAAKMYFESKFKDNPFISVNCELITDKYLDFLINNHHSPFYDNHNTLFISNLQALSSLQRKQLLIFILDTNLHKRNRIIFTCSQTLNDECSDPSAEFIDYLHCNTLYLPPLRNSNENLLSSCSLYLNELNLNYSKQIIGFQPDAITLLNNYHWPENFLQLKRVLKELVMLTNTPYITSEEVKKILKKEEYRFPIENKNDSAINFDYDKPLHDLVKDIVHVVLDQCNGNQSLAAKKLNISRTTLWRYLKQ